MQKMVSALVLALSVCALGADGPRPVVEYWVPGDDSLVRFWSIDGRRGFLSTDLVPKSVKLGEPSELRVRTKRRGKGGWKVKMRRGRSGYPRFRARLWFGEEGGELLLERARVKWSLCRRRTTGGVLCREYRYSGSGPSLVSGVRRYDEGDLVGVGWLR